MKLNGINLLLATIWLALLVSYSNQNQQQSGALRDHEQHIQTRATTTIRSYPQQQQEHQQLRNEEYREQTELPWQRSIPTRHARHTHKHQHQHKHQQQQQRWHGNQQLLRQHQSAEQKQQHNYHYNHNYHHHHQKHEHNHHHNKQQQEQQQLHPSDNVALQLSKNSVQNAYSVSAKHSHSHSHFQQQQHQQQQQQQPDELLHEINAHQKSHQQYYSNDDVNSGSVARLPIASDHVHAHNYSKFSSLVSDAPTTVPANTMPSVDTPAAASVDVDDDVVRQEAKSKSSESDATSSHNFKALMHYGLHAAPFKPTPEGIDYAADDYYDVDATGEQDQEQDQEQEYDFDSLDTDAEEDERLLNNRANSLSKREYARVTRDHRQHHYQSHGHHFGYESLHQQDYADDEPYNPAEQEGSVPGDLTKQKIDELGTEEAVQQSHDKYMKEQRQRQRTPAQLAAEHISRMDSVGRCRRPLPRVVPVSDETSKVFRPSCTWLHRCGPDTGCCRSEWEVCTNKSYENVQVYVYVYSISTGRSEIEVRTLENHTECHCVNRSYIPRYKRSGIAQSPLPLSAPHNHDDLNDSELDEDYWNDQCHCPTHFDALSDDMELQQQEQQQHESTGFWRRTMHNTPARGRSSCRCDCYGNNMPCQRLKRGEEGFAVADRKCVAERRCRTPTCAHGEYSLQTGRCPRQRAHKRASTHHHNGIG